MQLHHMHWVCVPWWPIKWEQTPARSAAGQGSTTGVIMFVVFGNVCHGIEIWWNLDPGISSFIYLLSPAIQLTLHCNSNHCTVGIRGSYKEHLGKIHASLIANATWKCVQHKYQAPCGKARNSLSWLRQGLLNSYWLQRMPILKWRHYRRSENVWVGLYQKKQWLITFNTIQKTRNQGLTSFSPVQ